VTGELTSKQRQATGTRHQLTKLKNREGLFSLSIALHLTHIIQYRKVQTVFNNQRVSGCIRRAVDCCSI